MYESKEILKKLTLEQKARLCSGEDGWHTHGIEELSIPSMLMTDGPHGLRRQNNATSTVLQQSIPATCFPTASATACSFDRNLLKELGRALGEEAKEQGIDVVLGPGINIKRSPLCGRNFEYFSEDPYLSGELASHMVDGLQTSGTGACIKHFAANNREYFRMVSNSIVDERTLREIYFSAFETVVKKSKPMAIMSAYNQLNSNYCGETPSLIKGVLREEWGYEGIVVSDWGACCDRVRGVSAGLDIEMPYCDSRNTKMLIDAVNSGNLQESDLDDCVIRILEFIKKCAYNKNKSSSCDYDKNHELAKKIAEQSAVLLKNDGVLPLEKSAKIALIGGFVEEIRYQGVGSSFVNPKNLESVQEKFNEYGIDYVYKKGFSLECDKAEPDLIEEAVCAAKQAGLAVVFAGLPKTWEVEGLDRKHIEIPNCQAELILRLCKEVKTIVVLLSGSVVKIPHTEKISALLHCHLGGEAVASAIAELLLGLKNPCGKLAETYVLDIKDTPSYYFFDDDTGNIEYREGVYVGYRYYQAAKKEVCFPFGFGLSYTKFSYSDFAVEEGCDSVNVSFTITNTGKYDGSEIAQVYTKGLTSGYSQLFGFEKVFLKVNESKKVTIRLEDRAFCFYSKGWQKQNCEIIVGSSSEQILFKHKIDFKGSKTPDLYDVYANGRWDEKKFYDLFDYPPKKVCAEYPFNLNSTLNDVNTKRIGRIINKYAKKIVFDYMPDTGTHEVQMMMIDSIGETPFRALVSLSGGLFNFKMADALIKMCNGKIVRGVFQLISAWLKRKKDI